MARLKPIPVNSDVVIRTCMAYFAENGSEKFSEFGIIDEFTLEWSVEEQEKKDSRTGVKMTADSRITEISGTVSLTLGMVTDLNRSLAAASNLDYVEQTSGSQTATITGVEAGGVYRLPHVSISAVTVEDDAGTPVAYTLGTHYEIDAEAGLIRIIAIPATASENAVVDYTAAAIVEADGKAMLGFASNVNRRGQLMLRGTNDGVKSYVLLHDVQLRPTGAASYQGDDYASIQLTGKIFADMSQAEGFEYGWEKTL